MSVCFSNTPCYRAVVQYQVCRARAINLGLAEVSNPVALAVAVLERSLFNIPPSADGGKLGTKLYHAVNLVILAGVPAAIATSPSPLTLPLDVVLGLALPLHAHIGMNYGEVS